MLAPFARNATNRAHRANKCANTQTHRHTPRAHRHIRAIAATSSGVSWLVQRGEKQSGREVREDGANFALYAFFSRERRETRICHIKGQTGNDIFFMPIFVGLVKSYQGHYLGCKTWSGLKEIIASKYLRAFGTRRESVSKIRKQKKITLVRPSGKMRVCR